MSGSRKSTIVGQFVPHRLDLIESPAWRALSLSARRVLDRIEVELCHHGGHRENGRLPVTYGDFVRYGVRRNSVASAIRECVALGLVVVTEQGYGGNSEFRKASKYRLTYIPTRAANPAARYPDQPTDDWKHIGTVDAAEHIASMARAPCSARSTRKQKSTPQNGTIPPPISGGENSQVPPPISGGTGSVTKRGVLSIFPCDPSCASTFATPDDATTWFTRLELRRHPPVLPQPSAVL
jgi:hypothetical protein